MICKSCHVCCPAHASNVRTDIDGPLLHIPCLKHQIHVCLLRYPERKEGIPAQARLPDGRVISTGAHADSGNKASAQTGAWK